MIKDLKLCFQVVKYSLNRNAFIFSGGLFVLLGIAMSRIAPLSMCFSYVAIGAMMGQQMIQSLTASSMIKASGKNKKLETRLPALFYIMVTLVCHSILLLSIIGDEYTEIELAGVIVFGSVTYVIIGIFAAAAMKILIPASIIFFIVFMGYSYLTGAFSVDDLGMTFVSLEGAVLISYVVIIATGFLMYLISLALYRLPYSKWQWETALKRAEK